MEHTKLDVWKEAVELSVNIYALTSNFPKEELYGLTSQIRRAAVFAPSNIAEGYARKEVAETIQLPYVAEGPWPNLILK